jgi:hypothetical protein
MTDEFKETITNISEKTKFNESWNLWYHPVDSDEWNLVSYSKILTIDTISEYWMMINTIENWHCGLFFLMKDGYVPLWEDEKLRNGGGLCFKYNLNQLKKYWIIYTTLCVLNKFNANVIGVSLSPKSKFFTTRIWTLNGSAIMDKSTYSELPKDYHIYEYNGMYKNNT